MITPLLLARAVHMREPMSLRFIRRLFINLKSSIVMKLLRIFTVLMAASAISLTAVSCREKGPAEKIGDKIDDALDARPGEPVRDAVEKVTE